MDDGSAPGAWTRARVRVSPTSVALLLGAVIAAIVIRNVFVAAHRSIGWAVATALLAMLLTPVVDRLARRTGRALALFGTVIGIGVIAGAVWTFVRIQIIGELDVIVTRAPLAADDLEERASWAREIDLGDRIDDLVGRIDVPTATERLGEFAGIASSYFVPGILMLFMLIFGPGMVAGAFAQLPEARRDHIRRLMEAAVADTRAIVGYKVVVAGVVGVVFGLMAWALSLPAPVILGLLVAGGSVLPSIGIVAGAIPVTLFAFGLDGLVDGLIVLGVAIGVQAAVNLRFEPLLRNRAGDVGPALILSIGLIAWQVYGIGGSIYAVIILILGMSLVRQLGLQAASDE